MLRRWLIRTPFLMALASVLTIWIASYFGGLTVWKWYPGVFLNVDFVQGSCDVGEDRDAIYYAWGPEFHFHPRVTTANQMWPRTTLGFFWGNPSPHAWPRTDEFHFIFPLWLPTLLLAALTWFIWRKTRPKSIGHAFPVEDASKEQLRPTHQA